MKPSSLQDDLILDFQEQKRTISEQVLLIDPMATSLRKPAAKRLLHTGFLVFMELLALLLLLAAIAFVVFMDKLYPYFLVNQLLNDTDILVQYKAHDIKMLAWGIKGIGIVVGVSFLVIARMLATVRKKNSVLNIAGKNMKLLAEQMLKRKAAMEMLEQRYPMDMPSNNDSIVRPAFKPHDDILL